MNNNNIIYDEPWDYVICKIDNDFVIDVMFCKSFVDYSVPYLLLENDISHLTEQNYFKILADSIRKNPDGFKWRIFNQN